jgi:hypothetical protein
LIDEKAADVPPAGRLGEKKADRVGERCPDAEAECQGEHQAEVRRHPLWALHVAVVSVVLVVEAAWLLAVAYFGFRLI